MGTDHDLKWGPKCMESAVFTVPRRLAGLLMLLTSGRSITLLILIACLAPGCDNGGREAQENHVMKKTPTIVESNFGALPDGTQVSLFTLTNGNGVEAKITNYGGTITSLKTKDRNGNLENIVLGFDDLGSYLRGTSYFGAMIGRYANRIARGRFRLGNESYQLDTSQGS